ncbi:alpha/beta hydrolase family protein [Sphingomonas sp. J315]|uniref:alpha/beta hydrolase family protein n=1 Tax=Sphingomonas sp. J315 TaxID=2898433 RepID=UPI0021ADF381|nr:alpha/beta fold hydrolase [Sphingomonas sp. J315]UUX98695.1 alpha/beta fold hydrolase [Sphingomonas sp. J315]
MIDDDAEGFSTLYTMDLATLERGEALFGTKGYDIGGIIPDATRTKLLGVTVHGDRPGIHWIDPEMVAMQQTVSGLVKGAQVSIQSVSADLSTAIIAIGGADAPGGFFLFKRAGNTLMPLGYTNPSIKMRRMHPVKTIRYKARDGLEIAAVLTLPVGRKDKLPLIVMPHGGPRARDSETWDWWAQFLADRGYAVIQPNYRGSTGYGTKFMEMGEGQWGLAMQDDLNDAVTELAKLGIADPKRVCMVGGSYGGYAAIRAAQRDGSLYRCAVSFAGVSDLNRMVRHHRNFLYGNIRGAWLREQAPDLKSVSPINFPEQFTIPVLLVHGEKDGVVPVAQSREMVEQLKKAGKDVTYIVQPEGGPSSQPWRGPAGVPEGNGGVPGQA